MNLCPTCGANLDLVGRVHRCVPRVEVGRSREGKPVYRVELPRVDSPPLVTKPPVTKGVVTKPDPVVRSAPVIARTPFGGRRPPYSAEGRGWG